VDAHAVGVGLDDRRGLGPAGLGRKGAPVGGEGGKIDGEKPAGLVLADGEGGARLGRCAGHGVRSLMVKSGLWAAQNCSGRRSSGARLPKRVTSAWNDSGTVPVGPWRCLPMMTSALPCAWSISACHLKCSSVPGFGSLFLR